MDKKDLVQASQANAFYCHNGQVFFNLKDLLDGLKNMGEEACGFHLNKSKNDFRLWIRDVLKDKRLARDIRWSIKKETIAEKIEKHLLKYYKI